MNNYPKNIKDDKVKMKMLHDLPIEKLYGLVIFLTFWNLHANSTLIFLKKFYFL